MAIEILYTESNDLSNFSPITRGQQAQATIKVLQVRDESYQGGMYIITDCRLRCGEWCGEDRWEDNTGINTTPTLSVRQSVETNAEILRRAIVEADEWFDECMARISLAAHDAATNS